MRRGLPRSSLSDNGTAMLAEEITEGLARLSIIHETTLAFSPYMNAKSEVLWANVESRLMAMLECGSGPHARLPQRGHPSMGRV